MRKLLTFWIALAAIALANGPVSAGWLPLAKPGGGGSPSYTATGNPAQQSLGFGTGTATFTTATGTGLVVVTIQAETNATNLSGVTLNGSAMTKAVASAVTNNRTAEIWYLAGQTANASSTIILTAGAFNKVGIQTAALTNVTATPTATAAFANAAPSSPYSVGPITIPSTGFGIASARWDTANTYTPGTGVTDDFTATTLFEGKLAHMGPGGGSQSATWTGTNFDQFCAAFAAWGP